VPSQPSIRLPTVANSAFPVVGARIWKDLPADEYWSTFRQQIKTKLSIHNYFLDIN